MSTWAHPGQ